MTDDEFNVWYLAGVEAQSRRLCQHDATASAPAIDLDRAPGERDEEHVSGRDMDREADRHYAPREPGW